MWQAEEKQLQRKAQPPAETYLNIHLLPDPTAAGTATPAPDFTVTTDAVPGQTPRAQLNI